MRSAPIVIAPLAPGEVDEVAAIEDPAHMTAANLREELSRPFARIWVARAGDAIAAFLVAWHVADELHVLNVATAPSHRRKGFARALMDHVVAFSQEKRLRHALLEVRRSNTGAIALYRSVGFFAMGVRPRYYPDDEDAVEMVLLFDPETGAVKTQPDEVRLD